MKYFNTFCRLALLGIICTFSLPAFSQGVAVYKKDGTMVKYAYEEVDSIVNNYGEETGATSTYEAVDLGLSVKWATFNVGATKPEEYGGYYAWGETEEKDTYNWSTYKWCNGSYYTQTKYCTDSYYGTVDNKTVLDPEDDVAHVKWGGSWRMPTKAEQDELRTNCTWTWTTQNGVKGYKVTGTNGNSIFLPAAGNRYGAYLYDSGSYGRYWSSSLDVGSSYNAYYLYFDSGHYGWGSNNRYIGQSVRPVFDSSISELSQGVAIYKKDGTMVKYAYEEIDSIVTYNYGETPETPEIPDTPVTPPAETQYEAVDLGLSVKWATFNVGASKPEEYGGYYAWGETEEKENYDWNTYKWCNGSDYTMTKYCTYSSYGTVDYKTVLDPEDDVAHVKWGGSWRMPTKAEQDELRNNCTWTWTTQNGVKGYKVTSKTNGNSIFLPAAGFRYGSGLNYSGSYGFYWSSSLHEGCSYNAYYLVFYSGYYDWNYLNCRYYGFSVRPVSK